MDISVIIIYLMSMVFLIGIVMLVASIPGRISSRAMKKFAESLHADFLRREKDWFFQTDSSFFKFNIITGQYGGQPLEIYHYKLSYWGTRGPFYHTYINGKTYDGLLSTSEITKVMNGESIVTRFSPIRKFLG